MKITFSYTTSSFWRLLKCHAFLCIFLVVASSSELHSQTLSFNDILLVSSTEDTVPAGKIWKITSILTDSYTQYTGSSSCGGVGYTNRRIYVDGSTGYIQGEAIATGNSNTWFTGNSLPLWLPSGSRLRTHCSQTRLSVIEFNLSP